MPIGQTIADSFVLLIGGLSEHLVVPEYTLYNCPDNVPLDTAALVEPLAVGWHAVNSSPFKPSDTALILGGGPIGR